MGFLNFLKKLFGVKTAETVSQAPYKIESPVVETAPVKAPVVEASPVVEAAPVKAQTVEPQITDAVTTKPARRTRKPKSAGQKPAAPKQTAPKQSTAPKQGGRGRKPKAKPQ